MKIGEVCDVRVRQVIDDKKMTLLKYVVHAPLKKEQHVSVKVLCEGVGSKMVAAARLSCMVTAETREYQS